MFLKSGIINETNLPSTKKHLTKLWDDTTPFEIKTPHMLVYRLVRFLFVLASNLKSLSKICPKTVPSWLLKAWYVLKMKMVSPFWSRVYKGVESFILAYQFQYPMTWYVISEKLYFTFMVWRNYMSPGMCYHATINTCQELSVYCICYVILAMYMIDSDQGDQEPSYNLSKNLLLLPRILKLIEDMVDDSTPNKPNNPMAQAAN